MRSRLCLAAICLGLALGGCARGGDGGTPTVPSTVMDIYLRMAGPVRDSSYYFIALDLGPDAAVSFPVPVAAGPFWGNGWGTGSITHFVEYHNGQYNLFATNLTVALRTATAGFKTVSGAVTAHAAGVLALSVTGVAPGAVAVAGTGPITAVSNASGQNAGTLALTLGADGKTVAGSVSFAPAADGGRAPNATEQAALDALNVGSVALAPTSLAAFGLTLTLSPAPVAGSQAITIAPAVATVSTTFTVTGTGFASSATATVTPNSSTPTATPPLAGMLISAGDLAVGDSASVLLQYSTGATLIGPPYDSTVPLNSPALQLTLDLDALGGAKLTALSANFITATELIFDSTVVDPHLHCYDGLGPLGNDAIANYKPLDFRNISNDTSFVRELARDSTLQGTVTQAERDAVDIIDWSVTTRRLR